MHSSFVGSAKMFSIYLMQLYLFNITFSNLLFDFVMTMSAFLSNLLIAAKHFLCSKVSIKDLAFCFNFN